MCAVDSKKNERVKHTLQPLVRPCGRCDGSKEEPDGSKCGRCGGTGREMTQEESEEWREKIRKWEEQRIKAWEDGLAKIK